MPKKTYVTELLHLEKSRASPEEKIKFIERLHRLANINFSKFCKKDWP